MTAGTDKSPSKAIMNNKDFIHCLFLLPSKNTKLTTVYSPIFTKK